MTQREDSRELLGTVWAGRYEILEYIGRGGMGGVFKARQIQMDREVALKVVHRSLCRDDKQVQRFEQEARTSSKLNHPNSIRVYDYGKTEDGRLFMAMEFLRGETLGHLLRREGGVEPERAVHIARQILKALAEAHQLGLVHRDLKPENIFICEIFGERDFVKVLDFGIAKAIGPTEESANLTQTGFICGTPRYLSPEQALGQGVDGRSDLYSVGVLLYEMLTGRPPFMGDNPISIVMKHVHDDPPPLAGMERYGREGRRLAWLVGRLMSKNADRRPSPAERIVEWMDGRVDESGLVGHPVPAVDGGGGRLAGLQAAMEEPTRQRAAFDLPDGPLPARSNFKDFVDSGHEATVRRSAVSDADAPKPPPMPPEARKPAARAEPPPPAGGGDETKVLRSPPSDPPAPVPPVPDSEQTAMIGRPAGLGDADREASPGETMMLDRGDAARSVGREDVADVKRPQPAPDGSPPAARVRRPTSTGEQALDPALTAQVKARALDTSRGRRRTPPWAWALAGVALTLMLGAGGFWWWTTRQAPPRANAAEPAAQAEEIAAVVEDDPQASETEPGAEASVAVEAEPAPQPEQLIAGTVVGDVLGRAELPDLPATRSAGRRRAPKPTPREVAEPKPEPTPREVAPPEPAPKPEPKRKAKAKAEAPDWESLEPDWDAEPDPRRPLRADDPPQEAGEAEEPEREASKPATSTPAKEQDEGPAFEPF
ncbi:MAG: protein kinase domain-containing protein [Myxococcota bacterium]